MNLKIRTYAVGGISEKNMENVVRNYGAYGVCPGSGMFNADAIFNKDFEKVIADIRRNLDAIKKSTVS